MTGFARTIGQLEATVKLLAESMAEQASNATASRDAMRNDVAALNQAVTALTGDVNGLREAVAAIQPTVQKMAEARLIGRGVLMGITLVATLTGSAVAVALQRIFTGFGG